ncbi:N-terminal half of MaoC dehydratase [Lentzea albidocapillata subsp. violacea]|uniref:N-terminal half of MaoC dehydratase n=1 Tax=Lentzea albidocapillata subsp. violacea TaxID=128104 RepID=A0A1G9V973_9PSEU|nr:MaoC/PaaZ C-terminal domain-containing protein [Lentzea albidocapillata]SDM68616.1 N-terminal half of MaoC dehydratase [Lentzea albidocapillata subsp. violacea]
MLSHDILGVVERQVRTWSAGDAGVYAAAVGGYSPAFPIPLLQHGGPQLGLTGADMTQVLHAEQSLWLHGKLPAHGSMVVTKTVTDIYDKGSGALVVSTWESGYASTRSSCFLKGEGGFGGERGETREFTVPGTAPEVGFFQTTENQALRYRETGDVNPMHHDAEFARRAGFAKPILHGLCTLGITVRGLDFTELHARFTAPVTPGDELRIERWPTGEFRTFANDRQVLLGSVRFSEVDSR